MVEGNDVRSAEVMQAIDRLEHQLNSTEGVKTTTSPADYIKLINYKMTGKSRIPDADADVKKIIDGYPSIFGQLISDNTHTVVSVGMSGSVTDDKKKEILKATQDAAKLADFPPGYNVIVTGDPAFSIAMNT